MRHVTSRSISAGLACCAALAGCDNSQSQTTVAGDAALNEVTNSGGALNGNFLSADDLALIESQASFASGFATPNADGTFSGTLTPAFTGSFKDADGNGFAYEVSRTGTALGAQAGILPGTQVGDLPPTGFAAMSGVWNLAEIGKTNGTGREFGEALQYSGRITLRADFDFGTLEGDSEDLRVLGTFDSTVLTGDVFFQDRPAALTGRIGADRAVGAFHGANGDVSFSGGFFVEP